MASPPITGNMELDSYLYSLQLEVDSTVESATTTPTYSGLSSNYFLKKYIQIKYADNEVGLNIGTDPTNRLYYGVFNSETTTDSVNPADYTWYKVTNGFNGDKFLFYTVTFGRNLNLYIATVAPAVHWEVAPIGSIDLDVVTDGLVNSTSFEAEYQPVHVVDTLPTALGYDGPYVLFLTSEGKIYKYVSGNWVKDTLTSDLLGTISNSQLANNSVSTDKIVNSSITTDKIDNNSITRSVNANTNSLTIDTIAGYPIYISAFSNWTGTTSGNSLGATITVTTDDPLGTSFTRVLPPVYRVSPAGMTYGAGNISGVIMAGTTGSFTITASVSNGDPVTYIEAIQFLR